MRAFRYAIISFCCGVIVLILVPYMVFHYLGPILVVSSPAEAVESIIVLGGGDGSRLRKAIASYDEQLGRQLIMVDERKRHWDHIVSSQCKESCEITGKRVKYVVGSTDTYTDAMLTLEYCVEHNIDRVMVVTDPYHSRRAEVIFSNVFKTSGICTVVINSGDYGKYQRPGEGFLPNWMTLRTICTEFLKIIHYKLTSIVNA